MTARVAVTRFRLKAGCLAALISTVTAPARAAPLPRESSTQMAARDANGTIWSVSGDDSKVLQRWTGESWHKTGFSPHPDAHVIGLEKRADGSVVALWNQSPASSGENTGEYFLSLHRGAASRLLSQFHLRAPAAATSAKAGAPASAYLMLQSFVGTGNSTWLVGGGRDFYHLSDGGKVQKRFVLPEAALVKARLKAGQAQPNSDSRPLFDSLIDGQGRTWFWNNVWKNDSNTPRLRGFLTAEKGTATKTAFTLRAALPGLPSGVLPPVQALAPGSANHLFLSLRNTGVFEIRTDSMRATSVAEPFRGAFAVVRRLWVSNRGQNSDLYVVAGSPVTDNDDTNDATDEDYTLRRNSLWRRRAGQWKLLIAGVDKHAYDEIQASRSFLQTSEGLWLGANGDGLYFVGRDDRAHLVNWRRGFDLPLRQNIFPLPNTNAASPAFLVTSGEGTVVVPGFALLAKAVNAPGVSTFRAYLDPVQDARLHLWAVLNLRDHALHEWDGTRWKKHIAPSNYKLSNGFEVALDSKGRIWIPSDSRESQSAIFDPRTGKWQIFPTYAAALLANRNGALPIANRNENSDWRGPSSLPRRSADGRLAFLSAARKIYLFNAKSNGQRWRSWKRREIDKDSSEEQFNNPPFFGVKGQLCVQLYDKVYELTSQGWKITTRETDADFAARHLDPTELGEVSALPTTPPQQSSPQIDGEESTDWDNGIRDGEGTLWLLKNRGLYVAPLAPRPPVARLSLRANQNQPFQDGRIPNTILVDARGNVFFGTDQNEWVMLHRDAPLPDTSVQLQKQNSGSFVARFGAWPQKAAQSVSGKFDGRFSWRLDGKAWSEPALQSRVELDSLAPGRHSLEVRAISAMGRPDPTPERVNWNVEADTPARLQQLIAQLGDPNFNQREVAVRALARQRAAALPLLRAALAKYRIQAKFEGPPGSENVWWLEAAIQEAERHH